MNVCMYVCVCGGGGGAVSNLWRTLSFSISIHLNGSCLVGSSKPAIFAHIIIDIFEAFL